MLKHLPEGLVPFEDCGFARHPLHPLAGESVRVDCRVDQPDGVPRLKLWVNGEARPAPRAETKDGRFYRFELGAFALDEQVAYQLTTDREQSRVFAFEAETEERQTKPQGVFADAQNLYLQMDGFWVAFTREADGLGVESHRGQAPVHTPWTKTPFLLPDDFVLNVGQKDFLWELKRFSKTVCSVNEYLVRKNARGTITHVEQRGQLSARHVWGTGERFHHVDQRHGGSTGRVVEKFTQQGDQTYLPVPFFLTENHLGWLREGSIPAAMDFAQGLCIGQDVQGDVLTRDRLFFGQPAAQLQGYLRRTGQPALPPEWAFGVWISGNGWNCDDEVQAQLNALRRYDYPADVMVLEAWSDEQTFYRWNDSAHWKNPVALVRRIRDQGLHLVLWQIPILKYEWDGQPNQALQQDLSEAVQKGYCVLNPDGTPYRITENWFHHSFLPDFTNPEACKWWFGKRKYLLDMGVEGFKTDGGEFLFDGKARLHNGMTGLEAHNLYPAQYVGAYHDFLRENGVEGVTFSRADFTGAQTRPMHWAGDQLSRWSELDAQVKAGLSAGLSGVLFWGFDIGGFAGELPSAELYLRATAMACFCPVMQWHSEPRSGQFYATHEDGFINDRSPWNLAEKLGDERVLTIGCAFAHMRQALRPYLWQEAQACVTEGRPLMAALCLDYPEDETACACEDEYMLGRSLLVAPVTKECAAGRRVYLPKGHWRHAFTHETVDGPCWLEAEVPLERIEIWEKR